MIFSRKTARRARNPDGKLLGKFFRIIGAEV